MLRLMVSKGYFLARRDTVRESSSLCSVVSSAMWRLYLRACEKSMFSLHLSEWLEWKWVFCTAFLIVGSLLLCGSLCLRRISLRWSVQK